MKKILLILIPLFTILLVSCSKEEEGSSVIWYGENTATNLVNDGANSLTYTVNGNIIGSTASTTFYITPPSCGGNGSITYTNEPGNYSYNIMDQTGYVYWTGTLNIEDNTCLELELTF
jgi:hypothetical protein